MIDKLNITWLQAIFISCIAAAASAILCIGMRPQSLPGALLFLASPLPLVVAGLSCNALVAALAALIGCLAFTTIQSPSLPLMYGLVVGLPSWLMCLSTQFRKNQKNIITSGTIVFGICCYVSILVISVTIILVPEYDNLATYLSDIIKESFRVQADSNSFSNLNEKDENVISIFVRILPHMSAISFFTMLVASAYLSIKISHMLSMLDREWPDFRHLQLPFIALITVCLALPLSFSNGYMGFGAEIFTAVLSLCFMLQGLAVLHFKLAKSLYWRWLLLVSWSAIIIFGFIGLGFTVLGLADFIFDFRKLRQSNPTSPNHPKIYT